MYVSAAVERTRAGVIALLVALSLLLSALPASAGPYTSRGTPFGWDFIDPSNITWEKAPPKKVQPTNITWENALRSITWE